MAKRLRPKRTSSDYQVGYGKPPRSGQFKKGQSGNPKGRPKGTHNFKTDVKATLTSRVVVTRDGKPRKISTQEAMLWRLKEKALNGDIRALNVLMALAQTFNNEELPLSENLSNNDEALLEIYNHRFLKGATPAKGHSDPTGDHKTKDPDIGEDKTSGADAARKTRKRPIKRVRLNRKDNEVSKGDD